MNFTEIDKIKRMKAHYPFLFPMGGDLDTLKSISNQIHHEIDNYDKVLITSESDIMRQAFFSLIINQGKYTGVAFLNAYRLVEIYLQVDPDCLSMSEINPSVAAIYYGYNEMENARQFDLFSYYVEQQLNNKGKVWVFLKGNKPPINQMKEYLRNRGFKELSISGPNSTISCVNSNFKQKTSSESDSDIDDF